jgi:hypothetical protein
MAEAFFQVAQAVIISRRIKSFPVLKCFHEDNRQRKRAGIATGRSASRDTPFCVRQSGRRAKAEELTMTIKRRA